MSRSPRLIRSAASAVSRIGRERRAAISQTTPAATISAIRPTISSSVRSECACARISLFGATVTKPQPPVGTGAVNITTSSPVRGSVVSTRTLLPAATACWTFARSALPCLLP